VTHCKCVACGIRCQTEGSPADLSGALCPHCGSLLEPVAELASVVGFRRITLDHDAQLLDDRGAQLLYARAPAVPRLGADA
jgi:hypothetical protein